MPILIAYSLDFNLIKVRGSVERINTATSARMLSARAVYSSPEPIYTDSVRNRVLHTEDGCSKRLLVVSCLR